jgi:hypothetical protein
LLAGLGLIAYLTIVAPASAVGQTSTAIKLTNDEVALQIAGSETQSKIVLDITMTADAFTDTPAPTLTPSETPTPTEDQSALQTAQFLETVSAADALATGTAVAMTEIFLLTLNPPDIVAASPTPLGAVTEDGNLVGTPIADAGGGSTPVNIGAVQQTATALANLFATPTVSSTQPTTIPVGGGTPGEATPTLEAPGGGGGTDELPDTGLFDDVFGGNPLAVFLTAFGLLGVIVLSRTLRKRK